MPHKQETAGAATPDPAFVAQNYGTGSLRFEPDAPLAISASFSVLQASIKRIPEGYALVCLQAKDFAAAQGALAGRKRVLLFDGGDTVWRKAAEDILRNVNAVVETLPARIVLTRGDAITPQPIRWIWDGYLARGKLHILAGAPGTGKTTLAMALGAVMTIGGRWPDKAKAANGSILVWSGEDDPEDILVPRLKAMGADTSRVHFISGIDDQSGRRPFDPARDTASLSETVRQVKPDLLILDPIVSAVAGDSHKNTETRRALQPLVDLAQEYSIALLGITHFSKGSAGRDPIERVSGSLAFGAIARIILVAAKLPDEKGGGRIFCRAKSNIGVDTGGFRYDLEQVSVADELLASRILWSEPVTGTARELLAEVDAPSGNASALTAAKDFLQAELANGPVSAKAIKAAVEQAGHKWRTIERAKEALCIKAKKDGGKEGWRWSLPTKTANVAEDRQQNNVAIFEELGGLQAGVSLIEADL